MVDRYTGSAAVQFDIEIVCDPFMPNTIVLESQSGGQMYNQNGGTIATIDMAKGDSIRLRYYAGRWTVIARYY